MRKKTAAEPFTWKWRLIDALLENAEWDRLNLDEMAHDCHGKPFSELTREQGIEILRGLQGLGGFKRWKRERAA